MEKIELKDIVTTAHYSVDDERRDTICLLYYYGSRIGIYNLFLQRENHEVPALPEKFSVIYQTNIEDPNKEILRNLLSQLADRAEPFA